MSWARLTIGVELASCPSLPFLDEPTSGLDGQSMWNLVRFLRKLADSGQAILCTIHQPSALLIQTTSGRTAASSGDCDWKDHWLDSDDYPDVLSEIEKIKQGTGNSQDDALKKSTMSELHEALAVPGLCRRSTARPRVISLWISHSFLQLGNGLCDLQCRFFGIYWVTILPAIFMHMEASSWIYSSYVFAIAQLLDEMPYSILCAILYWVLMVYFNATPRSLLESSIRPLPAGLGELNLTFDTPFTPGAGAESMISGALAEFTRWASTTAPALTLTYTLSVDKGWEWPDLGQRHRQSGIPDDDVDSDDDYTSPWDPCLDDRSPFYGLDIDEMELSSRRRVQRGYYSDFE
ncbi:hypothetical protein V8D89_001257 [Ganoderma adspersum]